MTSVRDILEAIRALPRADQVRILAQLREELAREALEGAAAEMLDHRWDREEPLAKLSVGIGGNNVETTLRDTKS